MVYMCSGDEMQSSVFFAGKHQLLVAVDCLGNQKFAYSACLKMFRLFARRKGCNDMKQSVAVMSNEWGRCCLSNSSLKLSPFLLSLVRFEADVCRAGFFSLWQATQFPQLIVLTARTKWVLITLCPNQMMDCPSGYHGYCVCILMCTCVCFLGKRPRGRAAVNYSTNEKHFGHGYIYMQGEAILKPENYMFDSHTVFFNHLTAPLNHLWLIFYVIFNS